MSAQEINLGPGAITVIGSLCPFWWILVYQWDPSLAKVFVFFDPTNLLTRQTSNHTFCRLRDIQDTMYILIVMYKNKNVYI